MDASDWVELASPGDDEARECIVTRNVLARTRAWWDVHYGNPALHCLLCLVLFQRVRFARGRALRQCMYSVIAPRKVVTPEDVPAVVEALMPLVNPTQRAALHWVTAHCREPDFEQCVQDAPGGVGIGPWTRKALGLMVRARGFGDVYLHEDAWVQARATQLGLPAHLAQTGFPHWAGYRGYVSLFLWRLTEEGATQLKHGLPLTAEHFLPTPSR